MIQCENAGPLLFISKVAMVENDHSHHDFNYKSVPLRTCVAKRSSAPAFLPFNVPYNIYKGEINFPGCQLATKATSGIPTKQGSFLRTPGAIRIQCIWATARSIRFSGGHEWRLLKLFHKKGLLLPIKDLLRKFIGKETIQCLTNPSAKWQEKLQKTI